VAQKKLIFNVVGLVLTIIGVVKLQYIGYYPSEGPLYFGLLIVALGCFFIAAKTKTDVDDVDDDDGEVSPPLSRTVSPPIQKSDSWAQPSVADPPKVTVGGEHARYCAVCGSSVTTDSAYCASCGAKVTR
jgi:hypothetical protein